MNQDREWILEEYRSCRKSLELGCYVAGGGAFGMFLRWLQLQLGFNELGLADPIQLLKNIWNLKLNQKKNFTKY